MVAGGNTHLPDLLGAHLDIGKAGAAQLAAEITKAAVAEAPIVEKLKKAKMRLMEPAACADWRAPDTHFARACVPKNALQPSTASQSNQYVAKVFIDRTCMQPHRRQLRLLSRQALRRRWRPHLRRSLRSRHLLLRLLLLRLLLLRLLLLRLLLLRLHQRQGRLQGQRQR